MDRECVCVNGTAYFLWAVSVGRECSDSGECVDGECVWTVSVCGR
jgi:hypothetical protein